MVRTYVGSSLVFVSLVVAAGYHQIGSQNCNAAAGKNEKSDETFLTKAAEINLTEMKVGELAKERGAAAAVRKFGERLWTDHSKMNKDLVQFAKSQNMTIPDRLDKKHQEFVDQLSKVKGAEFDHAFTKDMVAGHEKAIKTFETEIKDGQNSQVKAWAEKWVPTLREHLQLARETVKEVK